jgi:hypothetical protein
MKKLTEIPNIILEIPKLNASKQTISDFLDFLVLHGANPYETTDTDNKKYEYEHESSEPDIWKFVGLSNVNRSTLFSDNLKHYNTDSFTLVTLDNYKEKILELLSQTH